jgi:hypothetical protein
MEAAMSSETLASYRNTRRSHNPEVRRENTEFRIYWAIFVWEIA